MSDQIINWALDDFNIDRHAYTFMNLLQIQQITAKCIRHMPNDSEQLYMSQSILVADKSPKRTNKSVSITRKVGFDISLNAK